MKREAKRGSVGSSVLDAPEDDYAREMGWNRSGPAPAGALQRKYSAEYDEPDFASEAPSKPYRARREPIRLRVPAIPKSWWGRSIAGIAAAIILATLAAAAWELRQYLLHDAMYVVASSSEIQIAGNEHLSREDILSVFGADVERNIFKVPLADRRSALEQLPWVKHATVMRLLPNHIRIAITERTPVAFVRQGTQIGLVDADGILLDMPPGDAGDPRYSFPVLTGIVATDPISTRKARVDVYREFMAALDAGGAKLTDQLSEVDVTDPEDVKAVVASNGAAVLVHFGDEDFLNRFQIFEQHLPEWRQTYPKLASADMRYQDQIVLDSGAAVTGNAAASATPAPAATDAETASSPTTAAAPPAKVPAKVPTKAPAKAATKASARALAKHPAAAKANASNQKMFAQLAAAHKADLAKQAAVKKKAAPPAKKIPGGSGQ